MHYFHNYAAQITKHLSLAGTEQNVWGNLGDNENQYGC